MLAAAGSFGWEPRANGDNVFVLFQSPGLDDWNTRSQYASARSGSWSWSDKSHVNNQGPDQSSLISGLSGTLHSSKTIMHRLPCVHKEWELGGVAAFVLIERLSPHTVHWQVDAAAHAQHCRMKIPGQPRAFGEPHCAAAHPISLENWDHFFLPALCSSRVVPEWMAHKVTTAGWK